MIDLLLLAASLHKAPNNITDMGKIYTCPRCRRAAPKGPIKRPDPRYVPGAKKNEKRP